MRMGAAAVALALVAGCTGGGGAQGDVDGGAPADVDGRVMAAGGACAGSADVTSALTYEGDLAVTCQARPPAKREAAAAAAAKEEMKISAPIFPAVLTLYMGEGASYPTTADGRAKLAHDSAVTFARLLDECPGIVRPREGGPPLTEEQLAANYLAVETCAYEKYTAKPYWIPQLVADVDICAAELGKPWRRLTAEDLAALGKEARLAIAATLDFGGGNGGFYFSKRVFVVGEGATVAQGDLAPEAAGAGPGMDLTGQLVHYEGALALRCIKRP